MIILGAIFAIGASAMDVSLLDGRPFQRTVGGVRIDYDGHDSVLVGSKDRSLRIRAQAPARLMVASNGRYLVHNFGSGSGQVYNLSIYRLSNGKLIDVTAFKNRVLNYGRRSASCSISEDQISFGVNRWAGPNSLMVRTEDWSRGPGCERLNRSWKLDLQ
jgi:hypothetical protein